jgi:hypothetical protein
MPKRARLGVVLVSVLTLAATLTLRLGTDVSSASRTAVSSTMHGTVGPSYVITLVFDDGTPVLSLPAGQYRVLVQDLANDHNFHLLGPGVEELTSVEGLPTAAWNVTFRNNARYFFQCDPHSDAMFGSFEVGAAPAEERPSGSSGGGSGGGSGGTAGGAAAPARATGKILGTLSARPGSGGKIVLTLKGKPVTTIASGSYRIVVSDTTKTGDLTLRRVGAGKPTPLTGAAFVGSRTIATDLKPGQWKLYSSPREATTAVFFRVTK